MGEQRFRHAILVVLAAVLTATVAVGGDRASAASTLNGHVVALGSDGKLLSWVPQADRAYDKVVGLAWNYLLNNVPDDASTGQPAYLSQSYLNPDTQDVAGWPSNPAGMNSMLIESAMKYYQYSGNAAVLRFATRLADHQLSDGMTSAGDDWAGVPYASGDAGSLTYQGASYGDKTGVGDGAGYLEPDKVGEFGQALIMLFEQTGNVAYRDAAIDAADALAIHVRAGTATQSPWPFRVNAATGAIRENYSADVIRPIELFDSLIRLGLGDVSKYRSARTTAWSWLMAFPMRTNTWAGYYEDVHIQHDTTNVNSMTAMMAAKYLLLNPQADPNWLADVKGLISWTEGQLGQTQFGAETIREQAGFAYAMGSHTGQYAEVNALLYQKTWDTAAREKAYRAFNWSTYMTRPDGVVIDGPDVNNQWFTDGYGDSIRYYLGGMGAVPEWAPSDEDHLLGSTSVIADIDYSLTAIDYRTYDGAGTETLRLDSAPASVTAGAMVLRQRGDLTAQGWTFDPRTGVLHVRHDDANAIVVSFTGTPPLATNQPPQVSLVPPTGPFTAPANVTLQANATDNDGTVSRVEFDQSGTTLAATSTPPYAYTATGLAAGTYMFTAVAYDDEGASTTSSPVTVTVNPPVSTGSSWTSVDVGDVGVAGSTELTNGSATIAASGVDIWGPQDSFRFVYQQITGDTTITARVRAQQNTDPWALAGVMVRASLDDDSPHTLIAVTPGYGYSFDYRTSAGDSTNYAFEGDANLPSWIRLVRHDNTVTAYQSVDGRGWTKVDSATVPLGTGVYVGLAATSHDNATLGVATFDNIAITGRPTADVTGPVISRVSSSNVTQNGVTITWTTDESSTSQIEYGKSSGYGNSTAVNATLSTAHLQVASGLDADVTYHYRVRSVDAAGNTSYSGDHTFSTNT